MSALCNTVVRLLLQLPNCFYTSSYFGFHIRSRIQSDEMITIKWSRITCRKYSVCIGQFVAFGFSIDSWTPSAGTVESLDCTTQWTLVCTEIQKNTMKMLSLVNFWIKITNFSSVHIAFGSCKHDALLLNYEAAEKTSAITKYCILQDFYNYIRV